MDMIGMWLFYLFIIPIAVKCIIVFKNVSMLPNNKKIDIFVKMLFVWIQIYLGKIYINIFQKFNNGG